MGAQDRLEKILIITNEYGFMNAKTLSSILDVSEATIRRDFIELEKAGLVNRTHGAIVSKTVRNSFISDRLELPGEEMLERRAVGKKAVEFLVPGDLIFLGAGTTCQIFAGFIDDQIPVSVVTNDFGVAEILAKKDNVDLKICGGDLENEREVFYSVGQFAINTLQDMPFTKMFITVNGVSPKYGLTINSHRLYDLYSFIHRKADQTIIMADSRKFDRRAFCFFCPMDSVSAIITSGEIGKRYREACEDWDIRLIHA